MNLQTYCAILPYLSNEDPLATYKVDLQYFHCLFAHNGSSDESYVSCIRTTVAKSTMHLTTNYTPSFPMHDVALPLLDALIFKSPPQLAQENHQKWNMQGTIDSACSPYLYQTQ